MAKYNDFKVQLEEEYATFLEEHVEIVARNDAARAKNAAEIAWREDELSKETDPEERERIEAEIVEVKQERAVLEAESEKLGAERNCNKIIFEKKMALLAELIAVLEKACETLANALETNTALQTRLAAYEREVLTSIADLEVELEKAATDEEKAAIQAEIDAQKAELEVTKKDSEAAIAKNAATCKMMEAAVYELNARLEQVDCLLVA